MSRDENKQVVQAFMDHVLNGGGYIGDYVTPDFVSHLMGDEVGRDAEGWKESYAPFPAAFPDFHTSLEDVLAEDDLVAARLVSRGTHRDSFQGMPATGRSFEMGGMAIWRLRDGKIAEHWVNFDALGLLQQLGAMPAPASA